MLRSSWMRSLLALALLGPGGTAAAGVPTVRAVQGKGGVNGVADRTPAAFVLTSPQGVKVFVDVTELKPDLEAAFADPANLFLASHDHPDHLNVKLLQRFPGTKLRGGQPAKVPGAVFWTAQRGDVKVQAIASSHLDDELDGRTDTILVIDLGGVRVVHMGDCGQTTLTPAQRQAIGHPDVLIQLVEDPLGSDADVANRKAYGLIDQLAPTIVVPTHLVSVAALRLLDARWPVEVAPADELPLTPALLGGKRRAIVMGVNRDVAEQAGVKASGEL